MNPVLDNKFEMPVAEENVKTEEMHIYVSVYIYVLLIYSKCSKCQFYLYSHLKAFLSH